MQTPKPAPESERSAQATEPMAFDRVISRHHTTHANGRASGNIGGRTSVSCCYTPTGDARRRSLGRTATLLGHDGWRGLASLQLGPPL